MPDLGKYADVVLSAYLVGIVLLVVLTAQSLLRARKTRRQLAELESRRTRNG